MHGDSWFPYFGLGHWGLGLLVWLVIIIVVISLVKSIFPDKKD